MCLSPTFLVQIFLKSIKLLNNAFLWPCNSWKDILQFLLRKKYENLKLTWYFYFIPKYFRFSVFKREAEYSKMKAIILSVNKDKSRFSVANSTPLNHCLYLQWRNVVDIIFHQQWGLEYVLWIITVSFHLPFVIGNLYSKGFWKCSGSM